MVNTPMIRAAGPDDLGAVADLLTDAFLPDPIMSVIVAAAPDPRAALDHLHRIELASHYLSEDEAVRASARVDAAVDGSGRLLGVTLWDAPARPTTSRDRSDSLARCRPGWTSGCSEARGSCACSTTARARPTARRLRTGTCT